ncbi:MAG: hypothetical protein HY305_03235 [Sphingobacteriales bacterium]|nr:hypothetical protein [Sphingobacteriales bacterium]
MIRIFLTILSSILLCTTILAQAPKSQEQQELEKERLRLRKEIEQTQQLLEQTKKTTKVNLSELGAINHKLRLQEKVITNINKDINLLNKNIVKSQRDVRKLSLLLDTLKQEYSKSMVYSYKNRSNSDFLNFIFSASNFNDAIKRITYLRSYRNYREMQGDNISRTQTLLKGRINELGENKQEKSVVLETQSKEVNVLADQHHPTLLQMPVLRKTEVVYPGL